MSAITVSRPEVVNGHTDVICSTSVSHILAVRKTTAYFHERRSLNNFHRDRVITFEQIAE